MLETKVILGADSGSERRFEDVVVCGHPFVNAIAGHRDTFFRSLREIRPNDRLRFRTPIEILEYEVDSTEVVDPDDIEVLRETADAELTLVTCYPFNYIGAAPKRFIVHARQRD